MINFIKKILNNSKFIKISDIAGVGIFIAVLPMALIYKLYLKFSNKKLWVICEGKDDARDNGYILFKYIRETHPEVNAYYAININCKSYKKVSELENIINFGSFKHWVYYIAASKNISNHKSANPNSALFYILHYYKIIKGNRIFLQHGVTMNDVKFLHYNETKFDLFVCGAAPEYNYILKNFGYSPEKISYLGFPRFDRLWNCEIQKKQIVIMPTWRSWLGRETNILSKKKDFQKSDYYKRYQNLINNYELIEFIEKNDINIYFYPHANMQKFINNFSTKSNNIRIVTEDNYDIQSLISESSLMISDYSSVTIDFAYMQKPLIYYQFDKKEFRQNHISEGYFSYENMGFGPITSSEDELIKIVKKYFSNNLEIQSKYLNRNIDFFQIRDNRNCERIFNKILSMDDSKTKYKRLP